MGKAGSVRQYVLNELVTHPDLDALTAELGGDPLITHDENTGVRKTAMEIGRVGDGVGDVGNGIQYAYVRQAAKIRVLDATGLQVNEVDFPEAASGTGDIKASVAISTPTGWLFCDGSAVSRATYASLFSVISIIKGDFTVTIASPAVVTLTGHGMITGDQVSFTTTGALPTGLSADTNYFVIYIDANTFRLATTYANALAGTAINTSGSQSGIHNLRFNPYGISGSSNFLLPDLRAATLRGSGTSTAFVQNQTINIGGVQNDQIQGHYHSANAANKNDPWSGGSTIASGDLLGGGGGSYTPSITSPTTDGTNGTPRTGNETRMKNVGVRFYIKY